MMRMLDGFYNALPYRLHDVPPAHVGDQIVSDGFHLGVHPDRITNIPEPMRQFKCFIVPAGMGDIAWVNAKLSGLKEKIVLAIACQSGSRDGFGLTLRSFGFAELLENVAYVTAAMCTSEHVYWSSVVADYSNRHIPASPAFVCLNQMLEKGHKLDSILSLLPTDRHFPIKRPRWAEDEASLFLPKGTPALAVYTSSREYYGGQNMDAFSWVKYIGQIADELPKHKIILMGSPWDASLMVPVRDLLVATGYANRVLMMHDRHIATTLAVLRRSSFFIGAVSGLTIVAEYQKVPTVHLYPEQLHKEYNLIGTWETPSMVKRGTSLSLKMKDGLVAITEATLERFRPIREADHEMSHL